MGCSPGKQVEYAVSRFEQIFLADRLGQDAAPAAAPAAPSGGAPSGGGGGGGGGGMGMGASISIDPAAIIKEITGAVESGKAVENNPTAYFRELNNKLRKRMGDVKNLNDALANKNRFIKNKKKAINRLKAAASQQKRNLRNWLRDPNRKFKGGPLKGKYKDPLGAQIRRNEIRYIDRNKVKSIDRPRLDFNKAEIHRVKREAQRNWSHRKRTDLLKHWQDALNIETMKPMLSGKPEGFALMQMASTGFALTPTNLKIVFPDNRKYPHITGLTSIVEAEEAHRGIVPSVFRNPAATSLINLFSNGYVAGTDAAPNWLLGIKPRATRGGGITLDATDVETVFRAMYPDPVKAQSAIEARAQRLRDAGVIAGERDAGSIETVSDVVSNIRSPGTATAAPMPSVPYAGPAYEELPPAEPQYDPYAPQDGYAQPQYDPYSQGYYPPQQGYYPPQGGYYPQQGYYQQPQNPQSGYYPPQQPAMAGFHWRVPNVRR